MAEITIIYYYIHWPVFLTYLSNLKKICLDKFSQKTQQKQKWTERQIQTVMTHQEQKLLLEPGLLLLPNPLYPVFNKKLQGIL